MDQVLVGMEGVKDRNGCTSGIGGDSYGRDVVRGGTRLHFELNIHYSALYLLP